MNSDAKESFAVKAFLATPAVLALTLVRDRMTTLFEDGAGYILLADALVKGIGYRSTWVEAVPREIHFPPLLPLMIAPIRAVFGEHLLPAHLLMVAFYAAGIYLAYLLLRDRIGKLPAAAWTCFIATAPAYVETVTTVNSELPFVAASLGGLLLLDRKNDTKGVALAGLCFAAAFFLRTIGFTLFAAGAVFVLVKKDSEKKFAKAAIIAAIGLASIIPWTVWTRGGANGGRTYVQELFVKDPYSVKHEYASPSDIASRIKTNVIYYPAEFASLVAFESAQVRKRFAAPFYVFAAAVCALALWGWVTLLKDRKSSSAIYMPIYFVPILPWFWQYVRFLHPILFVAGVFLAEGIIFLLVKFSGENRRARAGKIMIGAALVLTLGNIAGVAHHARNYPPPVITDFYAIHAQLKSLAAPGDVVATRNSCVTSLLTDLKTVTLAIEGEPDVVMNSIAGARWLIASAQDPKTPAITAALMAHQPARFRLVSEVGTAKLYEILPDPNGAR